MENLKRQIINLIIERTMEYLSNKIITEENIDKIVNDVMNMIKSIDKEEVKKIVELGLCGAVYVKVKSKSDEF